jgi:hypothetical protein
VAGRVDSSSVAESLPPLERCVALTEEQKKLRHCGALPVCGLVKSLPHAHSIGPCRCRAVAAQGCQVALEGEVVSTARGLARFVCLECFIVE